MERLAIGRIRSSYGTGGFLKVQSFSGETEHFSRLEQIFLFVDGNYSKFKVEEIRDAFSGVLLKLEGVDSPEKAKTLANTKIWVERRFACPLEQDEYYVADLCGCEIYRCRKMIGKIVSIIDAGGRDLLEIKSTDKKNFMIPFTNHFVNDVKLSEGKIFLREDIAID